MGTLSTIGCHFKGNSQTQSSTHQGQDGKKMCPDTTHVEKLKSECVVAYITINRFETGIMERTSLSHICCSKTQTRFFFCLFSRSFGEKHECKHEEKHQTGCIVCIGFHCIWTLSLNYGLLLSRIFIGQTIAEELFWHRHTP